MRSSHSWNCCLATGALGFLLLLGGILVVSCGYDMLVHFVIAPKMALIAKGDMFSSWLDPPVQPHLTIYAFNLTNPQEVLLGAKPHVQEVGPFVYKTVTLKDTDNTLHWGQNGEEIIYRPRKFYTYEPALSGHLDPYTSWVTVPNLPLWTGLNMLQGKARVVKSIGLQAVTGTGRAEPFINVTVGGLLWGYEDDLPCAKMDLPAECHHDDLPFSNNDDFEGWGTKEELPVNASSYEAMSRPKAEFVDCRCHWGLFRDRNVTMREPIKFHTGKGSPWLKGLVSEFDGRTKFGWWKPNSHCDDVGGQDGSTLPPGLNKDQQLDIFIALMRRTLPLVYEKETEHRGIRSLRYVPPPNALGHHQDSDPVMRNEDNECYCRSDLGFDCLKSGALNMAPCQPDARPPVALSMPHFYQADKSYLDAVEGLKPHKEEHEFYMDVVSEFGFPVAIRPRFQLNAIIFRDSDWKPISNLRSDRIVLPFLWGQDGFDEPSDVMADKISKGLNKIHTVVLVMSIILCLVGAVMIFTSSSCLVHAKRRIAREASHRQMMVKKI